MTIGTIVQFNPSTLKVSYVAANDTVQMVWGCTSCDPAVGRIGVTITGLNDCTCHHNAGSGLYEKPVNNIAAAINGIQWILPLVFTAGDPVIFCEFSKTVSGDFGKLELYDDASCLVFNRDYVWDQLVVDVGRVHPDTDLLITCIVRRSSDGAWRPCFRKDNVAIESGCCVVTNIANQFDYCSANQTRDGICSIVDAP